MYFEYAIFTETKNPIMLIDGEIGEQINGARFSREMMELSKTASSINVWINSIGGSVVDAYQIISTINKLSIPVDTYNIGLAASAAFDIFVHGRKRYMMDYAQVMTHSVSGAGDQSERWNESVGKILASKSGKSLEEVRSMMDQETWMNADECLSQGFCDEIEQSGMTQERAMIAENKEKYLLNIGHALIENKKVTINPNYMKSVAHKLGLNEAANEEQVLDAVNKLEAAKAKAEADATNAAGKLTEVQNKLNELNQELEVKNAKILEVENAALEVKVTNLIEKAQADGRLPKAENDEAKETLNTWKELATEKFDHAEKLINALPLNKKAVVVPITPAGNEPVVNMANEMAKIANKTLNK